MAEIATQTLSFLDAAIACFKQIQIARSFPEDFDHHQIKLDIIQLRLSRWGEAAGIYSGGEGAPLAIRDHDQANELLCSIELLFKQAQKKAAALKPPEEPTTPTLNPDSDMSSSMRMLRTKLRASLSRRCTQLANAKHSIQWAFYKKQQFEEFVAAMNGTIDQLEKLFPEEEATPTRLQELSKEECKGISETYLKELKEIVQDTDPWLDGAVDASLREQAPTGGVSFSNRDNYGLQQGYNYGNQKGFKFAGTMNNNTYRK
ncbi:Heterokaryon incompatibility protein S [Lasiodiplodia theobromae]|uniref:Heterokaryon incompatibility protein S n=1 Tax=Lasiodiplodia theobromae TaxID=45133 RepID=A0A5N5CYS8_9PEZI|nr:Heterokaryon incompatibility protein S [Lasiodiplodia theobromae]